MIRRLGFFTLALALGLAAGGCRREDVREYTFSVPGLASANTNVVAAAVKRYGGVKGDSLRFDLGRRTLTLKYDSMQVAQTNLRMAIEAAGVEVEYPENTTGRAGH